MTQFDRTIIEFSLFCMGAGWCMASFVISAGDIFYMTLAAFQWLKGRLIMPRFRTFEEFQAAAHLSFALERLGRDYKKFRGITIVLPYREEAAFSREVAR